ncbi:serine hydrolase domain-containing protein [uncultured Croceitalea sp.]|uniref:serine hydrolase domain-containing protein n=1 Tax=uncultured Croceitalea sp. TaxID=1798908 RepID=UPI003305A5EA
MYQSILRAITACLLLSFNLCFTQSTEVLKNLQRDFTSITDEYLNINPEATGVMSSVHFPNHPIWKYNLGYVGREKQKRLTGNELFIAASITKTFVAACILQLEEEGLLSIDDKVIKYIDADTMKMLTAFKGKSYKKKVTIKHLLNHTSGIVDYLNNGQVHLDAYTNRPTKNYSLQERLNFAILHGKAAVKMGKYHYSNTNYILLGLIAEHVENNTIANIVQERIIIPLGLKNTSLNPSSKSSTKMFKGYYKDWDLTTFTLEFNKMNPAGGILTNVDDLRLFAKALFEGRLFRSPATLNKMLEFQAGYGLGVMLFEKSKKTGRVFGHSGFDPGYTTYLIYLEDLDTTIITVINQSELRVKMPAFLVVKLVAAIKKAL